jgi:hypothetical protein
MVRDNKRHIQRSRAGGTQNGTVRHVRMKDVDPKIIDEAPEMNRGTPCRTSQRLCYMNAVFAKQPR